MDDFVYQAKSYKNFADAVEAVQMKTPEFGFRVIHVHDFQAMLSEKGFARESLKIIEICNAKYAYEALQQDILISLMIPCRICVYVEGGKTVISTMRPTAFQQIFRKPGLQEFAAQVEKTLIGIIDGSR